jgi:hypothetical protein
VNQAPKLLVEWSSPWEEFLTSIRPALGRSPQHLAGEAHVGLFPYRGMLICWVVEVVLLIAAVALPARLASMQPYEAPPRPKYEVIYYSGDELPRTEDKGGAASGRSGRSGGQEAHHRTQTIRVARGNSLRETVVDAPKLNLPRSDSAVANLLAMKAVPGPAPAEGLKSSQRAPALSPMAVPPAPSVQSDKMRGAPGLSAGVIAPTPQVQRDQMQAAPALSANVIAPAPSAQQRDIATLRLPGSQPVQIVPPPVSAPEKTTNSDSRLTLPAPSVIAPPPTVARDLSAAGPGFGAGELRKQIVPPPAQMGGTSTERQAVGGMGGGLGNPAVVPPPVQLSGGSGGQHQPVSGLGGGTGIVPPPPTLSGGTSLSGQGSGSRGSGRGGALDVGSIAAPPKSGGSGTGTGIVVSNRPGSGVGVPGSGGAGALAMSPSGGDKPGLGGSGGGSGIGRGNGPGSGSSGEGAGAGKEGSGRGSDVMAKNGISPYPGPGGAGSGTSGTPAISGVAVNGGSGNTSTVQLPSFGSGSNQASAPGRSSTNDHHGPGITIEASPRSGGAFNFYGRLNADKVYTIYIETGLGTAVLEYGDSTSAARRYAGDLSAPEPIRAELPANLRRSRLIITCVLDRSGALTNLRVLESSGAEMTSKVMAALPTWKFRPAMRGDQPVEVNAILGFGVDTNDRF